MIVVFVLAVVALAPSKINYVCFVILCMIVIQGSYNLDFSTVPEP